MLAVCLADGSLVVRLLGQDIKYLNHHELLIN